MLLNPYRFAAAGGGGDPLFSYVVSLLHFEGANGSTTFTDVKGNTWTAFGNAQLSTSGPLVGTSSLLCDGNGDYIQSSGAPFNVPATTDFCWEFFVEFVTVATRQIFLGAASTSLGYFDFRRGGTPRLSFAGAGTVLEAAVDLSAGVKYHVAVSRAGNVLRIFIDGVLRGSFTGSTSSIGSSGNFQIGAMPTVGSASLGLNGKIDEVRMTVGVPRYTASFTPPTGPFPDS